MKSIPDPLRHPDCMPGDRKIPSAGKEGIKLESQKASLRQHTALLLDLIAEILLKPRITDYNGFPKQSPHLGASDIKYVAEPGQLRKANFISLCRHAVAQPGSVQKQQKPPFPAGIPYLGQLL